MNQYQQIKSLSDKISRLLATVEKNNGRFSAIDKDLLSNYVRELYEMIVSVHTQVPSATALPLENPPVKPPSNPLDSGEKLVDENDDTNGSENDITSKEIPLKKTISEIYSEKKASTVNDKFKKQGLEIADKLKQTPIKDLKSYIGLNKQFAFMSKLFNADEQLYEEVIGKLNGFKSYEEASAYIKNDLLPVLNWRDDEPLVGEFFTLVMRRYLN